IRQIKGTTGIEGNTLSEAQIAQIIDTSDEKHEGRTVSPADRHELEQLLRGFVEELEGVQAEILDFVREVMFRDYIRDLYQSGLINQRCYTFLTLLLESRGELQIGLPEYRERRHPLIEQLYTGIKSKRTIQRDLETLLRYELIAVTGQNRIQVNVAVMNKFAG
ncbi:MAG TPA: hypothetical protein VKZ69_03615, partial [Limnochordales bacterium]|nr:hypothetical protein [Limnochordales bacterium]